MDIAAKQHQCTHLANARKRPLGRVGEPKNGKYLKKGGLREHRWREVARGRVTSAVSGWMGSGRHDGFLRFVAAVTDGRTAGLKQIQLKLITNK